MKQRHSVLVFLASAMLAALTGCGGQKRPPVVTQHPGGAASRDTSATGRELAEPVVDTGPDLRPVENEGARGEEIPLSDAYGEGGPLADVQFDYDQATLTDQARAVLEKHALWLQNRRDVRVAIEGHCDERGTVEYNLALGDARARVAREYLVSLGVAAERLSAVSYGKERPLDAGHTEEAWARNRRAHFLVTR